MEGQICEEHGRRLESLEHDARESVAAATKLDYLISAVDKITSTQSDHGSCLAELKRDRELRIERARTMRRIAIVTIGTIGTAFLSACGAWLFGFVSP